MNKTVPIIIIILVATSFPLWYFFNYQKNKYAEYDTRMDLGGVRIRVDIAKSLTDKYLGLSGRESMCDECGMLFVFDEARVQKFVMRGMKFDLDFVFIANGKVVDIQTEIPKPQGFSLPQNVVSRVPADNVLELNSGFVQENGIQIGQSFAVDEE